MLKKRILIVGSNGMLGQRLVEHYSSRVDVELLLASAEEETYFKTLAYKKLDITNKKDVKKVVLSFYPDVIINVAAYTNVDKCESEKELAMDINANGVEYLAKYSVPSHSHLIHISTDYVFDGCCGPYSETDLPNPIGYYGRTKLAGENIIRKFDIPYTIIRTNVLFGNAKYGRPDFVKWVVQSLTEKKKIKIVTDQINNPTYLDDLVSGISRVTDLKKTGLFNIGGAEQLSRFDFTRAIANYFNLDFSLVEPIKTEDLNQQAPRPLKSGLINLKAETEIGYKPRSIIKCLELMKKGWK
ncbi:MAG: dTDP-4-dehydrorhamnose reductase [Melioribacteraceae bacterium]